MAQEWGTEEGRIFLLWQPKPAGRRPTGSEEVARDPEVRALRARLKRAEQELAICKKSLGHLRPAGPVSACQPIAQHQAHVPARQLCQVLRVASAAYDA